MSSKSLLLVFLSILFLFLIYHNFPLSVPPKFLSTESSSSSTSQIYLEDVSSLSNINEVRTQHFHLNWLIDFENQVISGTNTLHLLSLIENLNEVHLDIRGLKILEIYDSHHNHLDFNIEPNQIDRSIGDKLRIFLKKIPAQWELFQINIVYKTLSNATALNWLTKQQTSSKLLPYLFSQCESIHCRTIAPLQDTPAIKATYSAQITVPNPIVVFMSANVSSTIRKEGSNLTQYNFKCDIPIPSYLLAIVAGNIVEKQVGPRTFVITEPNDIDSFSKELEDLEEYLITVENYVTKYMWGYYKIVVLPPSFPYGGMENPLLTFASPTIIAGDKSGVFVAIHEIGHSWTGNWITCQNWESFWLNEGFTVFLERKGGFILSGLEHYKVASIVGNISVMEDFNTYGFNDSFSSLRPNLTGKNPDDAFSTVPYEKGFQFLVYIESLIGEQNFQKFFREYIEKFAKQSIVYQEVIIFIVNFIENNFNESESTNILSKIDFNRWIISPGMPPIDMSVYFRSENLTAAIKLAKDFIDFKGEKLPDNSDIFNNFDMNLKLLFLQHFLDNSKNVTLNLTDLLEKTYKLNENHNSEIAFVWLRLNVRIDNEEIFGLLETFLGKVGRMKFIRPLYLELNEKHHELAVQIFTKYESFYHPIAVRLIKNDLNIN